MGHTVYTCVTFIQQITSWRKTVLSSICICLFSNVSIMFMFRFSARDAIPPHTQDILQQNPSSVSASNFSSPQEKPDQETSTTILTPRKKKMRRTIQTLHTRLWRAKKKVIVNSQVKHNSTKHDILVVSNLLDKLLPGKTAAFVKSQIRIQSQNSVQGYRWTLQDKMFALSVFYHSRKAYSLLRKMFCMPSKATLLKMLINNIYLFYF